MQNTKSRTNIKHRVLVFAIPLIYMNIDKDEITYINQASSSCSKTATDAKTHLCEGSSVFIVKLDTIGEYTFARCMLVYTGHE